MLTNSHVHKHVATLRVQRNMVTNSPGACARGFLCSRIRSWQAATASSCSTASDKSNPADGMHFTLIQKKYWFLIKQAMYSLFLRIELAISRAGLSKQFPNQLAVREMLSRWVSLVGCEQWKTKCQGDARCWMM